MTPQFLAIAYAALALLPAAMQIALATGAPLGRFTVGGRFPGRLPPAWRILAVIQCAILLGMAAVVLGYAGVIEMTPPKALFWAVVTMTVLTTIGNVATPSKPERLAWGPVTLLMTIAIVLLAVS